jgi:hopene-associated glycosyltransferase HpnB
MHQDYIYAIPMVDLIAALPLLIWLYMLVGRGDFWRASRLTLAAQDPPEAAARVAVVVPARNEAEGIGRCVTSLLAQQADNLRIFVVDDGSTDGTADIARASAVEAGRTADVTIIPGRQLPDGWTGKLWAVQQGIEAAREFAPEFILLTDADIVHASGSMSRLIGLARARGYDLTSLMVRLSCESGAERFLIPSFVFFFFMLYPPRWIASSQARIAGAAGGCVLVGGDVLERLGGVSQIRNDIIDDCALARLVKRSGGKVWLGLADETFSLRPYPSIGDVVDMIARSAFSQLRHSALLLLATLAGLGFIFLLPIALLFTGRLALAILGASAWLLMSALYLPTVRYYRRSALWAFTLPFAAGVYMAATVVSAVRYWFGRGGQWKGRAQDVAP